MTTFDVAYAQKWQYYFLFNAVWRCIPDLVGGPVLVGGLGPGPLGPPPKSDSALGPQNLQHLPNYLSKQAMRPPASPPTHPTIVLSIHQPSHKTNQPTIDSSTCTYSQQPTSYPSVYLTPFNPINQNINTPLQSSTENIGHFPTYDPSDLWSLGLVTLHVTDL